MEGKIVLEGVIENVVYHNEDNGYTVFLIEEALNNEEITCVGYIPKMNQGEMIKITGNYVVHPSYGKQFKVELYEKTIPTTSSSIEKYLASGVIKGVGGTLAKRIVEKFGVDTLDIIEQAPERLSSIKGISVEKAMHISSVFHEQAEFRRIMFFLNNYGISTTQGMKIYKRFKQNTYDIIEKNPYSLSDEIFGIGFKIADDIASKVGIESTSEFRIKAGLKFTLSKSVNNGNVYLPKNLLLEQTSELLNIELALIESTLLNMQVERTLIVEAVGSLQAVYMNHIYYSETYIAKKLLEISMNNINKDNQIDIKIKKMEKSLNINLAEVQKQAIVESMENGVLVITGGPGTGKTTIIKTIINMLQDDGYEIVLAAPTGKASKRLSESTGMEAKTIHRLLEIAFEGESTRGQFFGRDEDNPIDADVIIVDEVSMIDTMLMSSLLKAVDVGSRLILVGDVDQLPSVGAGNVLSDIIYSGNIKVVRLVEIFRQSQESHIVMNAHKINKGEYPIINQKDKDFFFLKRSNTEEIVFTIMDLMIKRLPSYTNINNIFDIQILTPMRKSSLGVENLNIELQKHLNPKSSKKNEKQYRLNIFREGDKVMQIKNNYNISWKNIENEVVLDEGLGVFNGDTGIIQNINDYYETITVIFEDNRVVEYDYSQLDELELAYAITIHKSQGSEYKVIVMPMYSGSNILMNRNLLYTAITRAKELVVIVGSYDAMKKMINNNMELERYSNLRNKIETMSSLIGDDN